jgi:hypothetical protein
MTNFGAVLTAIALAVFAGTGVVANGQGKKGGGGGGGTVANPLVTVGFSGLAGDGLLGDTLGNYVGGKGGVTAELQPNGNPAPFGGFANVLLNIMLTSGKNKRLFTFDYPAPISVGCDGYITGPSPTRTNYKYAGWLNVHSIGAIAVGEVRAVKAFLMSPDGEMGYTNEGDGGGLCSTPVAVYRSAWNTWTISTDIARLGLNPNQSYPGVATCDAFNNPNPDGPYTCIMAYRGVDDWAAANGGTVYRTPQGLNQLGFTTSFVGNYEMQWAITVTTTDARMQTNYATCTRNGVPLTAGCSFPY